jgi:hypothetical protein
MERWWDGTTWTEYTRTAPVPTGDPAAGQQLYGGQPPYGQRPYGGQQPFGYPSGDVIGAPGGRRRRPATVVIAIVAALVVIGGVIAGIVALDNHDDDNSADKSNPVPTSTLPPHSGQPSNPQSPDPDDPDNPDGPGGPSDGPAVDLLDGISLPLPDGWQGGTTQAGVASIYTGVYDCPGNGGTSGQCTLGGVSSQPAKQLKLTATTAEGVAKEDIKGDAAAAYAPATYGKTTSHQEIQSKAVTVAGQQGYLVRWKVDTTSGTQGYVESLAFPSPSKSSQIVVVRFGFDVGGKAPGQDVIDQITQGIKADTSAGSSGSGGTGV